MDGVITDTEFLHATVESKTAKHFGIDISPEEVRQKYSGMLLEKEFEEIFKNGGKNVSFKEAREVRDRILIEHTKNGIKLIPYAREVLTALSQKYKMALVSSTERFWAEKALKDLKLFDLFEVVIFGEDVKYHKPNPEPYLKAMELLGVSPEESVVIEDSKSGQKAGKDSGAILIARKSEHNKHLDFSQADFVITDLREIPGILNTKLV